jgi:hypothetical protein
VNALNAALREIRKIVIIYIVVFYNIKLPKQDIYYILVPRYILYLYNLARVDSFKIYKDGFRNLETVFKESRVCELAICKLRFCDPRSAITNRELAIL